MRSSKPLVQEIRKLARERLRASKPLWKEYKRIRRSGLRGFLQRLGLIFPLYPAAILLVFALRRGPTTPLLVLTLYSAATVLGRANALSNGLYRSWDLAFFMHLPVADEEFFKHNWQRFLTSSLFVWFYSILAFGYLTLTSHAGLAGWIAALTAATLQWFLVVSLVVIVEIVLPSWPKMKIGILLYALTLGSIFLPASFVVPAWRAILPLPTAWIPYIFERGVLGHESASLYLLMPSLLSLFFLPLAARRLRESYPTTELTFPLVSNAALNVEEYDYETNGVSAEDWRSPNTDRLNRLRTAPLHLRGLDWNASGWIEGLAGRLLNEREKKSADFLCGGHLGSWSALWLRGLKVAGVGAATLLLPNLFAPWIGIAIGVLANVFALPLIGGRWEGMQLVADSGGVRPAFTGVPLSYTDTSRVLAKIYLLRYAVWFPVFLAYGALLAWRMHMAPIWGTRVATEIILVLISFQPILIAGLHSYGTNDTGSFNLHSILAIFVLCSMGIIYGVCWIVFFITTEWAPEGSRAIPAVIAVMGTFLCSLLIWRCYKLFYDRGRMDTMRVADR